MRYLVAGGVAVNAHGYQRLTNDLDLGLSVRDRLAGLEELCAASDRLAHLGRSMRTRDSGTGEDRADQLG
ncbi:hypothetical protein BH20GEM2_BH20GEM2_05360 [soil metagenome]